MSNEAKAADGRAKKAAEDIQRMTEELRNEQEHARQVEQLRKTQEHQVKELQVKLEEAEAQALKGGKKQIAKLEQRVSTSVNLRKHSSIKNKTLLFKDDLGVLGTGT